MPCRFPGVIASKRKTGAFRVKFLADIGQKDCVVSSMMPFRDYATRQAGDEDRKLFDVPKKYSIKFKEATKEANNIAKTT